MGADRKGPLAAFVVVAIVAAVLLITSVRSQAAPGFLDPSISSTVMAAPRAATGLWRSIDEDAHQVVAQGMVLAHKAGVTENSDDSVTTASPAAPVVVQPPVTIVAHQSHHAPAGKGPKGHGPARHGNHGHGPARPPHSGQTSHHGRHGHDAAHHADSSTAGHDDPVGRTGALGNNGLHLGWTADDYAAHYGHAFGHGVAPSNVLKHGPGDALDKALKLAKAAGHGRCHGNGFGRTLSNGRGIAFGRPAC